MTKVMILEDEQPRSEGVQYATEEEWREITNSSRKDEDARTKQKQHPVMDVTGDGSKVRCCKDKYCIGTWNVRSRKRQIGSGQTGESKSEHQHFRSQEIKMDWKG